MIVKIRQHAEDRSLNDLNQFFEDIDIFFAVEEWQLGTDEYEGCELLGDRALEIERMAEDRIVLADSEFRLLYKGIYQTIWGAFTLLAKNRVLAAFNAVDSCYWEIESSNPAFIDHMVSKYGLYVSPFNQVGRVSLRSTHPTNQYPSVSTNGTPPSWLMTSNVPAMMGLIM